MSHCPISFDISEMKDSFYKTTSGKCIIIANTKFDDNPLYVEPVDIERDVEALRYCFSAFNFNIEIYRDFTRQELFVAMDNRKFKHVFTF